MPPPPRPHARLKCPTACSSRRWCRRGAPPGPGATCARPTSTPSTARRSTSARRASAACGMLRTGWGPLFVERRLRALLGRRGRAPRRARLGALHGRRDRPGALALAHALRRHPQDRLRLRARRADRAAHAADPPLRLAVGGARPARRHHARRRLRRRPRRPRRVRGRARPDRVGRRRHADRGAPRRRAPRSRRQHHLDARRSRGVAPASALRRERVDPLSVRQRQQQLRARRRRRAALGAGRRRRRVHLRVVDGDRGAHALRRLRRRGSGRGCGGRWR